MKNDLSIQKRRVRITVLKKIFNSEFLEKYAADPNSWTECKHFNIGDEYVTDAERPWEMPAGFCSWAWSDIQKIVYGMARGGQDAFVTCCTDGYRPVVFGLEKIRE